MHAAALKLAFDRASVRSVDADGRLHIEITNISKAAVNPYLGKEIPNGDALGLIPDKLYYLLRDPDELEKGAATFNNLPVLSQHVPVTVDDHQPEVVIGSTGTDAVFEKPFLKNSMVIWVADSIEKIESKEQTEISSAYRYVAVMRAGNYEGVAFDGVMTDIIGNHVAIVDIGRAGPDVVVADNLPKGVAMKISRRALAVKSAVLAYVKPKLAQDAKLDLSAALKGVTAKNFDSVKLTAAIAGLIKPKLAQDADLEGLAELVDAFKTDADSAVDELPAKVEAKEKTAEDAEMERKAAMDAGAEGIREMCKGKLSEDDMTALDGFLKGMAGERAEDEAPEAPEGGAPKPGKAMDKKAMDAAIKDVEKRTIQRMNAVRQAEQDVEPHVGKLAVAMDSAAEVYAFCLKQKGIDTEGVDPSAYRALVKMLPDPHAALPSARIAMDEASVNDSTKMFPALGRYL